MSHSQNFSRRQWLAAAGAYAATAALAPAQAPRFELLLRGGRVLDPQSGLNAIRDVAIADGKIAAVDERIDPASARVVADCSGLYVTPGFIDIHVHVFAGTNEPHSYAGDNSLYPDGYTFRSGVTTVVDAGCAGWRNFETFKETVIDRSKTRVLAMLNIVGSGMRGGKYENNLDDMQAGPTAELAKQHKGLVVGVKCAHYSGPEWQPVETAVKAGEMADIPVMIDFGSNKPERPLSQLLTEKLRPGDIYTHCYSGLRDELVDGKPNPALFAGRKRGVIFDVGHGGGSFAWRVAIPCIEGGFPPDSISTDLHTGSMNAGMKSQINVMSKFLNLGLSLEDVIKQSTWNPAKEVKREDLGRLSVGSVADVAVIRQEEGEFGFVDSFGGRLKGTKNLECELTLKDGRPVWDLNGLTAVDWQKLPPRRRR
ncbi:MAG: amidohydrolase/deacetylase family metallohydrolase [Bryobacterales bacterium]